MKSFRVVFTWFILLTLTPVLFADSKSKRPLVYNDSVQIVELNHMYDENCHLMFDQFIFYDFYPGLGQTLVIREWKLAKEGRKHYTPEQTIENRKNARDEWLKQNVKQKDRYGNLMVPEGWENVEAWEPEWIGDFNFEFNFNSKTVFIHDISCLVKFNTFNETWTQADPELENRQIVGKDNRIPLNKRGR